MNANDTYPLRPGTCPECRGTGMWGETSDCPVCGGRGMVDLARYTKGWECVGCGDTDVMPGTYATRYIDGSPYHWDSEVQKWCGPIIECLKGKPHHVWSNERHEAEMDDLRRKLEETAKGSRAYADDCEDCRELLEDERRKSEEANLENGRLLNDRKMFMQMLNESERERASLSLVNAALRTALKLCEWAEEGCCPICGESGEGIKAAHALSCELKAAITLPADSIVQEVVWLLEHVERQSDTTEWLTRRATLIKRIRGET